MAPANIGADVGTGENSLTGVNVRNPVIVNGRAKFRVVAAAALAGSVIVVGTSNRSVVPANAREYGNHS